MTKAVEIAHQITIKPKKPTELTKKAINKNGSSRSRVGQFISP
jgi:hypothetical protein